MSYKSNVAEAKRLRKRSEDDQWRLAELTYKVVEEGTTRRQWARDIGLSAGYASDLYQVWTRFGVRDHGQRPTFWACVAKVQQRDDSATGGTRTAGAVEPKAIRRHLKGDRVPVEDKVDMLADLASDPKVMRAYREQRAPKVSEHDHKAAEASADAFSHKIGQAFSALEVPRWFDWLKEITTTLAEYEYDEDTITKLSRAARKLMDEIEVQQFRLGLVDEDGRR